MSGISVVILTLNEQVNIADCLASCAWSDDVHVLDSGSTDKTVELARQHGAEVHSNPFESFGAQRNWAIDNIPFKHEWVFHLDADERFTPELVAALRDAVANHADLDGFHVPSRLMFLGRWLRRTAGYPTYQMRFFNRHRMRFIDHGHGQREDPSAKVGRIEEPYDHYVFSKGLYDWFEKHNRYSSLEALQVMQDTGGAIGIGGLLAFDPVRRRRAWKNFWYRLPLRAQLRYFVTVFILGGITEGRAGLTYARLMATYEQMISLKLRLLRAQGHGSSPSFEKDTPHVASTKSFSPESALAAGSMPAPSAQRDRVDEHGQLLPESSPWTLTEKIGRALWMLAGKPLFRVTFHNWYGVRRALLRFFGAKIGKDVRVRPTVNVEVPWNIHLHDGVTVGDNAILYSLGKITIGERTIISQYAHLCAGTHDHTDRRFPLIRDPIVIGRDTWIGADAYVGPNVTVGELAVLGARSSAYKDLDARTVYVGNPAKPIKARELHDHSEPGTNA